MDRENTIEFFRYITTPLTKEEMMLLYQANNIKYDKCQLYYDFIKTLNLLIVNTYLGDDAIKTEEDKGKHFIWCFNKVVESFAEENIMFESTDDLKFYFYNFYHDIFYVSEEKENSIGKLNNLPNISFTYNRIKTRSDIDILVELYKLFEKSLNFKLKN